MLGKYRLVAKIASLLNLTYPALTDVLTLIEMREAWLELLNP